MADQSTPTPTGPPLLSRGDLERLMADPSPVQRADAAAKVSRAFSSGGMGERERTIAQDIFRVMVKDAAIVVREALSRSLKDDPNIPHDVAKALAIDVESVALPMIQSSLALSEQDLLEIVASNAPERQLAVARRTLVPERVADALVDTRNVAVVAALVANDGARISDKTMNRVVDEFGALPEIHTPMAKRAKLPISVVERLVKLVSDNLREHLVTHHDMSPDMAADLLLQSRERATLAIAEQGGRLEIGELVGQLHANGRLTGTLILRALCTGDLVFFETALARLADVPVTSAYRLIHDPGANGLERLYRRCGLPEALLPVVKAAVEIAEETELGGGEAERERFRQRMIERVLTNFEDGFDVDNLDYYITRLGRREPAGPSA